MRRPQPRLPRLLLKLADECVGGIVLPDERLLVRVDVLLHERPDALAPLRDHIRDDNGRHLER